MLVVIVLSVSVAVNVTVLLPEVNVPEFVKLPETVMFSPMALNTAELPISISPNAHVDPPSPTSVIVIV